MTQLTTKDDAEFESQETASRADDGYFGWTDRYGIRSAFVASPHPSATRRPYFIANY